MHQGSTTDHARHIAEYVVKLIYDSHNVRLRRLLFNTKGPVILQLVSLSNKEIHYHDFYVWVPFLQLSSASSEQPHEDLNLLLNLVDLLSICTKQVCPLAEEYCQRIFSCETLIE